MSQDCSLEDGSVDVVMSELDFPEEDTLYSGYRDAALKQPSIMMRAGSRALPSDTFEDNVLIQLSALVHGDGTGLSLIPPRFLQAGVSPPELFAR